VTRIINLANVTTVFKAPRNVVKRWHLAQNAECRGAVLTRAQVKSLTFFSGRNLRQRWKGFAAQIDRVIGARAANNHVKHKAQLAVVAFLFLVNVFNLGESDFFTDFY